jgi:hypothetical protein
MLGSERYDTHTTSHGEKILHEKFYFKLKGVLFRESGGGGSPSEL